MQTLRAMGCQVWFLSGTGNPDLLVKRAGRFYAFEVKSGKAKLTPNQNHANWPILRCVEDALAVLGSARSFSPEGKADSDEGRG